MLLIFHRQQQHFHLTPHDQYVSNMMIIFFFCWEKKNRQLHESGTLFFVCSVPIWVIRCDSSEFKVLIDLPFIFIISIQLCYACAKLIYYSANSSTTLGSLPTPVVLIRKSYKPVPPSMVVLFFCYYRIWPVSCTGFLNILTDCTVFT